MHYIVIIVIIVFILSLQIWFFVNTKKKIRDFRLIFYEDSNGYKLSEEGVIEIVFYNNETLRTIIDSINDYLKNNQSVSDFHLMKDIVDRNCDAKEEEISTQIPFPLYLGLGGTMAGILVGIFSLLGNGGIGGLFGAGGGFVTEGIEALLGGVALAMISSIAGIGLTTWGSYKFKNVKSKAERYKNTFLSWIQVELLPVLSDNVVGAIKEMANNLTKFNKIFSTNIGNLDNSLGKINDSYRQQKQLLTEVQKIVNKNFAVENIKLFEVLKNSTKEIGILAEYLKNTNDYFTKVHALNEKLDYHENRTRTIEEMGDFFKKELQEVEARKGAISMAVGKVDEYLKQALERLKDNANAQFDELLKSTVKQQDILLQRAGEIEALVTELKQLTAVKESISRFEQVMSVQNSKLDKLANAIQTMAEVEAQGPNVVEEEQTQTWQKTLIWTGSILGGLTLSALIIANWDRIYTFIVTFFRI